MSRWVFWGLVCGRWDSNPQALRRHPLKMVRLPVPPLPHEDGERILAGSDRQSKSNVAAKKLRPAVCQGREPRMVSLRSTQPRCYQTTTFWRAVEKVAPAKEVAVAAAPIVAGSAAAEAPESWAAAWEPASRIAEGRIRPSGRRALSASP